MNHSRCCWQAYPSLWGEKDSWEPLLWLVPSSADFPPQWLRDWMYDPGIQKCTKPSVPMHWKVTHWQTGFVTPALTWDLEKSMLSLGWSCRLSTTSFSLCFSWRDGGHKTWLTPIAGGCSPLLAMETSWFFCSDLECWKTQQLIAKSLKPLAEWVWLCPWRQEV